MAGQGAGHEARAFHVLDEGGQPRGGPAAAALGQAHGLADQHEMAVQQAQPAQAAGVGFQLLPHAGGDFHVFAQEGVHHGRRGGRAEDFRLLDFAGEVQVVGAALADHDALAGAVHVFHAGDGGVLAHQVGAFDDDVGRGEGDLLAAFGVDGEEAHVGLPGGDGVDRVAGGLEYRQFQFQAQAPGEFAGEVHRHAARLAGGRIGAGEYGIAQVDGSAQGAGGGEGGKQVESGVMAAAAAEGSRRRPSIAARRGGRYGTLRST
ncbi:hypothetical protein AD428_18315 [Achromobacter sp. DMS1]|nr:hypothetical protein AD428_18315 [Achromobacter sp. DMS1]